MTTNHNQGAVGPTLPGRMSDRPTIAYQPALDGVRALAVAVVLLFHAEVPGFDGGYLGVSVFFTLSGYLITSLLVHEHARTGRIALGAFYARRVRRLVPASAVCLAAIAFAAVVSDVFDGVADLRRDIVGAVLQVANWVFLAGEGSYQDIFQNTGGTRSPVEHFWSLAIEEQFYWVWPPTMLLILTRLRSHRARTLVLAVTTAVFVALAPVIASVWGPDAAYWATPARISEILLGALLALILAGRAAPGAVPSAAAWAAPVALAGLAACVVLFPASSGPAYEGWLPAIAVVSTLLILGLQAPGPVRSALSLPPLVWLGTISYGVYLYHWPIYVILDRQRTGLSGPALVGVQLVVTLVVAQASYTWFEQPLRRARRVRMPVTFAGGALATTAVVALAVTVVPKPLGEYWITDDATVAAAAIDPTAGDVELLPAAVIPSPSSVPAPASAAPAPVPSTAPDTAAPTTRATAVPPTTVPPTTVPPTTEPPIPPLARPVRIVVAGDSTARANGTGLLFWAAANPELAQVEVVGAPGCGFLRGGERREGEFRPESEGCRYYLDDELPRRVAELQPDVVMMMVTSWDLVDRRWDGVEYTPLDGEFEQRLLGDYAAIQNQLLDLGAGSVAWVKPPIPNVLWRDQGTGQEDPARHAVAGAHHGRARAGRPGPRRRRRPRHVDGRDEPRDDRDVRPDGVHVEPAASVRIAEEFLGEQLVRAALGL
jgi:peptidoglycan/LPS O-acetylase OafA/YrhL